MPDSGDRARASPGLRRGGRARSLLRVALPRPALGFLLLALAPAAGASDAPPGERFAAFTDDGAWCWFSGPRARYHDGRLYAGWMTADGAVQVGRLDPAAPGRPERVTLAERFEADDHDHPALAFLPDGRLAAFYARHARGDLHLRLTAAPGAFAAWTPDRELGFATPATPRGLTYANPLLLAAEHDALYLFWRGGDFKPTFAVSTDLGASWSPPRTLLRRAGSSADVRPYVKYWTDGRRRIDFLFTDGHPRDEPANSVYFLRYADGVFTRADGTRVGTLADLPLDPARCDRVYDGSTAGRAWVWDLVEDAAGQPVAVYTRLPAERDHRYHYARWDGRRWDDHEVVAAGAWFPRQPPGTPEPEPHYSGGIVLDPRQPATVYLARPVAGVFEIERWTTSDGGAHWTSSAVTAGSATDNVRPVVALDAPAGAPDLLWMQCTGGYTHYTQYRTTIRLNRLRP